MSGQGIPVTFTTGGAPVTITNLDASMIEVDGGGTVQEALDDKAPLASPALTGTPTAPTAAVGTNTTQVATMAAIQAAAAARVLFNSVVPFVIPSSGTMGDNGALTMTTALSATFAPPAAYVYLPLNAIVAGSAAGWYYTTFSSTTVGQVFNNTYSIVTGGEPTVPAVPTPFVTTGPGAYAQDVAAGHQALTYSVPANTIGVGGKLVIEVGVVTPSNANVKSIDVRFTATSLYSSFTLASVGGLVLHMNLLGHGATNRQVAWGGATPAGGAYNKSPFLRAFDMTAAQSLNVFPLTANVADYMIVTHMRVTREV